MKKLFYSLIGIGLLIPAIVVGMFVYNFAVPANFVLSTNLQNWSYVGSFIGGFLGPLFAFFAFIGVLLTVRMQIRQIEYMKSQAKTEELQRLIANTSKFIDNLLNGVPKEIPKTFEKELHTFSIFSLLSAAGTLALIKPDNSVVEAHNNEAIEIAKNSIGLTCSTIAIELDQLVWCFQEFMAAGGNEVVVKFYKRRYEAIVCWMDAIGIIDRHQRIEKYFAPIKLRESLRP